MSKNVRHRKGFSKVGEAVTVKWDLLVETGDWRQIILENVKFFLRKIWEYRFVN